MSLRVRQIDRREWLLAQTATEGTVANSRW